MTQALTKEQISEWLEEFRADEHMNAEAFLELKTLCTMALSHADAYERGQRDMAAAAVKWHEDWRIHYCDKIVQAERVNNTVMTRRYYNAMKHHEDAAQALRALSPGEWVALPARMSEAIVKAMGDEFARLHKEYPHPEASDYQQQIAAIKIFRALIAAAQEK